MRKRTFLRNVSLLLAAWLLLAGCGKQETAPESEKEKEQGIQIGFSFDTFVVERWQRDRDVFVSTATELGAQVNVQNANGSVEEQVAQMEYFIEKGVDVIVVVPIDAKALETVIEKAQNKGIGIISYDRLTTGVRPDLYISFNNESVGTLMGKAVARKLNKGDRVLMICGPKSDGNVAYVEEAFRKEMETAQIAVADVTYIDDWKAELAAEYVSEHLDEVRNVQAIMCGNDNLATYVIQVLAEQRLAGKICVVGQDADLDACQRIVAGTQYMTVYKPVERLAKYAAESAVALAKGELPQQAETIMDEKREIPFLKLEPLSVTAANMEATIVASGFHLKEDIYIDRPNLRTRSTEE